MEVMEHYKALNVEELWNALSRGRVDRVEGEFVYLEHNLSKYFSKTLKNPPNDPDGSELFGETVNLRWKRSTPFEVFKDDEPGGHSNDPAVIEKLEYEFRHSTIGVITGCYVVAEQRKKYLSIFLSKLGIKNIPKGSFDAYFDKDIVSEIKQTNRGFTMLLTARRARMDFALVEDKSAHRRRQKFIWTTLDSLVRSRAIADSIRTDVFLATECRADVEGTLGGYPEVLLRYGFKLSWGSIDARKSFLEEIDKTMYTPRRCNLIWNEFGLYNKAIHFRNALLKKTFYKDVKNSRLNIRTNGKLQKHFRTYVTYIKYRDRTKKNMSDKDLKYFFMALPADIQSSFKSNCTESCSAFRDFINETMVTHAHYLSRVVKTANRAKRNNEALGGNENENEGDEGNENEEDNETESESGNENEEDIETESESGNENVEDNEGNENEEDNETESESGNENEEDIETESESGNENEEDIETESESGNENEEDIETDSESRNENEEAGPEADPETDQEADSDDV